MARSFSNSKLLSVFVSDSVSSFINRRRFAAASQGAVSGGTKGGVPSSNVMMQKSGEESVKTSWLPDPITGYYRPEGQANEIDAAELRKMLLKHKSSNN